MNKKENPIIALIKEHQNIASLLSIILSIAVINSWATSDIRNDVHEIRADIREVNKDSRETNKRIDALFQYVLTKEPIEKEHA